MRQPLATIMALSSCAEAMDRDNEPVVRALSRITSQAGVLLDMIRSTLEDDGGFDRREVVPVLQVLADVVTDTRETYAGTLTVSSLSAQAARVHVDPSLLRRAVTNLLDNAVRAAGPTGHVRVRIVASRSNVDVIVEDDGPGLGHIPTGCGIGVQSVRRFAADCGGLLDLRDNRSCGVRARLRLPRWSGGWGDGGS